jgi:hypothetical protein
MDKCARATRHSRDYSVFLSVFLSITLTSLPICPHPVFVYLTPCPYFPPIHPFLSALIPVVSILCLSIIPVMSILCLSIITQHHRYLPVVSIFCVYLLSIITQHHQMSEEQAQALLLEHEEGT